MLYTELRTKALQTPAHEKDESRKIASSREGTVSVGR